MVNRFTPKAQLALSTSKKCAEKMGHSYIGSEHLILGILSIDCVGKKLLEDKRIFYNDAYNRLSEIAGLGHRNDGSAKELTPKCKKIIEGSSLCAKRFGAGLIGTEHILYSLCEEGDSVGGRILSSLGVNLQILKNEIATFLDAGLEDKGGGRGAIPYAPTLSLYGKNMNYYAKQGKCDPIIGRERELERLIQILSRRTKNNPCLIGEPGVGKTAIVEGLAQKINEGSVPENLLNKTVVSLDLASMIAGAKYRGEFEERMKGVMNELKSNDGLILFIDEIHTIVGAGAAEGAVDASNIIKPTLARGQIQVIGATTISEYRKYIEKDAALERRFQPITVNEPSESETVEIIKGLRSRYEDFHKVKIPDEVIVSAVKLSVRYITDRFLPDKAIDLIDEACSKVKMKHLGLLRRGEERQLMELSREKERAVLSEDLSLASEIHEQEELLRSKMSRGRGSSHPEPSISVEDIEGVVTQWTSIPVSKLEKNEREKLCNLESSLKKMIIGQENAVDTVAGSIKRGRAGLKNPKRPIGSFLFLGPTGVGKTELAKSIAQTVFGSFGNMIRLDMSEYMEKHSISKLIGSPPGYVGYEEGGRLTTAVRSRPYSVVLFDEIEKAHPDIYNILLQILDDGKLTDSFGREVSFKNTILIMTSNIGAKSIVSPSSLGFGEKKSEEMDFERMKQQINEELKREFHPELLNRLDEIIIFNRLSEADGEKIASIMLRELTELALDIGIELSFDNDVYRFITQKSFDRQMGARPLRRAIMSLIENPLSQGILKGDFKSGDKVLVSVNDDKLCFKSKILL
ncbi:MAG: ATP-dependent Clp protease ATP-binding subunit [Clostridia bacterium]|nr:ATP-dependent Clp protease ATP-binding subunit [Clostridia bacterium]